MHEELREYWLLITDYGVRGYRGTGVRGGALVIPEEAGSGTIYLRRGDSTLSPRDKRLLYTNTMLTLFIACIAYIQHSLLLVFTGTIYRASIYNCIYNTNTRCDVMCRMGG